MFILNPAGNAGLIENEVAVPPLYEGRTAAILRSLSRDELPKAYCKAVGANSVTDSENVAIPWPPRFLAVTV
ncbi:hypothetical protein D3C85_1536050 [compost metagenome]